jgi:hypothetical protein
MRISNVVWPLSSRTRDERLQFYTFVMLSNFMFNINSALNLVVYFLSTRMFRDFL